MMFFILFTPVYSLLTICFVIFETCKTFLLECQMAASNDNERARHVISHEIVEKGHPMQKFMAGKKFIIGRIRALCQRKGSIWTTKILYCL